MSKTILSLCAISILLIVSCKPLTVLFYSAGGMVQEDKTGGWERIQHVILRYQNMDTLHYLFDSYTNIDDVYPCEIQSPYVCYVPKDKSGVLGVHVEQNILTSLDGGGILDKAEIDDFQDAESYKCNYFPIYRYLIHDSVIQFMKLTCEEREINISQTFFSVYTKGDWLRKRSFIPPITIIPNLTEVEINPDVIMIFNQIYEISYKYLNGRDTVLQHQFGLYYPEERITTNIPMYYLPLESDVYYQKNMRKHLVKKRLGFYTTGDPFDNLIDDYRHEIDTALLALPVRIFQEKYLQTNDIYCLDGLIENK